jgi:hypothetical protein
MDKYLVVGVRLRILKKLEKMKNWLKALNSKKLAWMPRECTTL